MNSNEEILASDYSNTIYFEITGENKNHYLSKLTHFDLRPKKISSINDGSNFNS